MNKKSTQEKDNGKRADNCSKIRRKFFARKKGWIFLKIDDIMVGA